MRSLSGWKLKAICLTGIVAFCTYLLIAGCTQGGGGGEDATTSGTPPPAAATVTATAKLIRLDGQELEFSAKPIPVTVSVNVIFSEAMDTASVESAASLIDAAGNAVAGTWSWNADQTVATWKPQKKLQPRTTYKLQISDAALSASAAVLTAVDQPFTTMTPGDVNGDGIPDLVVAAGGLPGTIYVYSGAGLANNPITPMATISGEKLIGGFDLMTQVSMAGDVNADGYADLVIGVPSYDSMLTNDIGVGLYFSGATLFGAQLVSKKESEADAILYGRKMTSFQFGVSISGGFDVDGDGYDDVIIGEQADMQHPGAVYVYSGKGLTGTKNVGDAAAVVNGAINGDLFGISVSGLKDIDGDGKDDLMTRGRDGLNPDKAYVFRSKDLSANTTPANAAVVISPTVLTMFFAVSVASAGDVNGDGTDDLMIMNIQPHDVYLFSGKDVPATGSVNLDETKAIAGFKNLPAQIGLSISIAGAGDVDGNGRDDVVIGVSAANVGGVNAAGKTWVYGIDAQNIQNMLGDLSIAGAVLNFYFGSSVSAVGDIDGDEKDDIAVAARGANNGLGVVYLFSGASLSSGPKYTINGATVNEVLGSSVAGAFR